MKLIANLVSLILTCLKNVGYSTLFSSFLAFATDVFKLLIVMEEEGNSTLLFLVLLPPTNIFLYSSSLFGSSDGLKKNSTMKLQ